MTQQYKDLVNRLMDAETICVYCEDLDGIEVYMNIKINYLTIFNDEFSVRAYDSHYEDWDCHSNKYGKTWAFTEEELRNLRIEDRKRELRETIEIFQKELKELEEQE